MSGLSSQAIRKQLKQRLPAEAFEPQPVRGITALLTAAGVVALGTTMALTELPIWVDLVLSLVLGQGVVSAGLASHEAMHRAVFKAKWAQHLMGWIGFSPYLVTPGLWTAWHNQAHHGYANQADLDPDMLPDASLSRTSWLARARAAMVPGSRNVLSYIAFAWLFTLQGQVFLWVLCDHPKLRDRIAMNRWRERALSLLVLAGWIGLAILLGPLDAWWIIGLPMIVANATLMTYISTQHWLRPRVGSDDPVLTTVSVEVPRFVDWIHYRFSHHQEHHIFPSMSARFAPMVRAELEELAPGASSVLPIARVMRELFRTPVLYADDRTLVQPDGSERVDLAEVAARLPLAFDLDESRGG